MRLNQIVKTIKEDEIEAKKIVPKSELRFVSYGAAKEYIDQLGYDDVVQENVINDADGEIVLKKGESKRSFNWTCWGFDKKNVGYEIQYAQWLKEGA